MSKADYQQFLASAEWRAKRDFVRQRAIRNDEGLCERCGGFSKPMSVHHLTYKGHADDISTPWPHGWDCDPVYLMYVCSDCHNWLHGKSSYDPSIPNSLRDLEERIRNFNPKF